MKVAYITGIRHIAADVRERFGAASRCFRVVRTCHYRQFGILTVVL
jgi:hypothetical protein